MHRGLLRNRHKAQAGRRSVSGSAVQAKSRLPLAFSVPKGEDQRNEDSFHRSAKGVYALSDGASVSFDSAAWARILVKRYARKPEFTREWLAAAIAEFGKLYDRDSLPWMQQASLDRGSFASLLGVRLFDAGGLIQLLAIGDSLAVLCDGDCIKATFPFSEASQFNRSPQLLCTNPVQNVFLDKVDLDYDLVCRLLLEKKKKERFNDILSILLLHNVIA